MNENLRKMLSPIGSNMYSCSCCGKSLKAKDMTLCCSDCGAVFCESCAMDGSFESHQCDDDDFEFDD